MPFKDKEPNRFNLPEDNPPDKAEDNPKTEATESAKPGIKGVFGYAYAKDDPNQHEQYVLNLGDKLVVFDMGYDRIYFVNTVDWEFNETYQATSKLRHPEKNK